MSRRSRNLAGLAALGALGFMAGKGLYKRAGEELAPVEYRGTDRPPVEDRPPSVRGDMSPADLYADAAARVTFDDDREPGGSTFRPPAAVASAPAVTYRPRRGVFADDSQRSANAAADAMFENRAPAAAPRRRSSYDEESVFNPGQDIGPNISGEISRITGVKLDNPAGAGRSSGIGGATAEEMERDQEYRRMVRKANALAESGVPYGTQTDASALTYYRTGVRPSTVKGGRGAQGGPTARELEAYRRQQEELAKRGRGFNTTRRKEGGAVKAKPKKMASGGVSSASKRGDGIASKGKTKCKIY